MDPRELLSRNSAVKFVAVGGILFCAISAISYVALGYQALPWINNRKDRIKRKKSGTVNIGAIFGMDVGGTLTKIVYFQANQGTSAVTLDPIPKRKSTDSFAKFDLPDHQAALKEIYSYMESNTNTPKNGVIRDDPLTVFSSYLDGRLHFLHFETKNMLTAINYLSSTALTEHIKNIGCTGGGAYKFGKTILDELDIQVHKYDELGCLVRGMIFALTNFPDECYTYRVEDDNSSIPENLSGKQQKDSKSYTKKVFLPDFSYSTYPYLVVNIGSGVSILKVSGPGQFERVSGTSLGGGTYWGLCRLLTKCRTYGDVLDIAESGDAAKVDMLVKDIYGGDYDGLLSGAMVASSFGKLVMKQNPHEDIREEDLALALLMMITNNIGQIAYLVAQLHGCSKIFFVGNFLRHNTISCRRLAFAIDFWSKGKSEALFLAHEGYFGALGTFLQSVFGENVDTMLYDTKHTHDKEDMFSSANDQNNDSKVCEDCTESSPRKSSWRENIQNWAANTLQAASTSPGKTCESNRSRRVRSSSADEIYLNQKSLQ